MLESAPRAPAGHIDPRRFLLAAAGTRSLATGLTGVLLGLALAQRGLRPADAGLVIGMGLAGNAIGTAVLGWGGERIGRLPGLVLTTLLASGGLLVVAFADRVSVLAVGALLGLVNGMGRDRGPAQTLEQSLLADSSAIGDQTRVFARYALVQDVFGAIGSLAAGLPALLAAVLPLALGAATRWTFVGAAVVTLAALPCYLLAAPALGPDNGPASAAPRVMAPDTRRRIAGLTALFALDSLGGGFLAGSILSFWFFHRFGMGGDLLGPLFFAGRVLNALSYGWAEALARRIGLVRTMVYTHLPSSLVLIALPFAPAAAIGAVLFLVREALVQMDVPTRQAYVAELTAPGERTSALAVTGLTRNVGWAAGPPLAGLATAAWGMAAPLFCGAGLKIVYDLALFASFRAVHHRAEGGSR